VDRQPVFFSDDDCRFYLDWLGEYASKRDIALHAYCLMTNHVHLLLFAPSAGALSGLMQHQKKGSDPFSFLKKSA